MMIREKFSIDGFYVVSSKIETDRLIKASSRQEAEDIFDEYNYYDIDYMCGGRENITGSRCATCSDITNLISDGYLERVDD